MEEEAEQFLSCQLPDENIFSTICHAPLCFYIYWCVSFSTKYFLYV